jgi:transposase
MRRTTMLWKVFATRFEEAFDLHKRHRLTGEGAGELLGMSGRNFRRLCVRYEKHGIVGLRDCRIGRVSVRRAHARELERTSHLPKPYGPRSRGNPRGHSGTVARRIRRTANFPRNLGKRAHDKNIAFEWMRAVLQKEVEIHSLRSQADGLPELGELLNRLYDGKLADRNRSMVILATRCGLSRGVTCRFLGIDRKTAIRYLKSFKNAGASGLFARQTKSNRKFDDPSIKNAVFELLHAPPTSYGINRTTWTMAHLSRILKETGCTVSSHLIAKIIKLAGYRWRKARIVLTSKDPAFSEKLDRVRSILSALRSDEAFFSIDEFGPFAVKTKPGLAPAAPGEQRIVPQWQKSRGCLILTAALELSGNQVHHFFSTKKNTAEMVHMMNLLIEQYHDRRKIFLSWDAASWHISKQLYKSIDEHNAKAAKPTVETAPLPAGAQFLNVIESVFSGMARAIIHNSNYKTSDDAKAAINGYFAERNAHFNQYPRRAGNKIWRNEREPAAFSDANDCKDPRYR